MNILDMKAADYLPLNAEDELSTEALRSLATQIAVVQLRNLGWTVFCDEEEDDVQ